MLEYSDDLVQILKEAGFEINTEEELQKEASNIERLIDKGIKLGKIQVSLASDKFRKVGFNMHVLDGSDTSQFWQVVSENEVDYFVPFLEVKNSADDEEDEDEKEKKKKEEENDEDKEEKEED